MKPEQVVNDTHRSDGPRRPVPVAEVDHLLRAVASDPVVLAKFNIDRHY